MKNIPLFKVFMSETAGTEVSDTLKSGYIGQGPKVERFEDALQRYLNTKLTPVTTNSATSAAHLIFHMMKEKFKKEDHVICPSITCTATNWPVLLNGINIKWADTDINTCNVDLTDIQSVMNEHTKAILVVHWGGYPVDLDRLDKICEDHKKMHGFKPYIIEDCAHAFGSKYKGINIGNHGNTCFFSFQAIKHLTTGDGGAIVSKDQNLLDKAKLLRWYGIDRDRSEGRKRFEQNIEDPGFKFHMNDISATIGLSNIKQIPNLAPVYRKNGHFYNKALRGIDGITLMESKDDVSSSFWLYTLRARERDKLQKHLKDNGIASSKVHGRNDKHLCVSQFKRKLPGTSKMSKEMLCIPVGWWVGHEEREYIVETIKKGW